jgi:hypothetical protein
MIDWFGSYFADPLCSIETRSLPALAHRYPCDFTFYVADPVSSIHEQARDNFLRLTQSPLQLSQATFLR